MLGVQISDPCQVEAGGSMKGMELLPVVTELKQEKTRTQVTGIFGNISGVLAGLSGKPVRGYEIHMGSTKKLTDTDEADCVKDNFLTKITDVVHVGIEKQDGTYSGNVYGTYVHGIFDEGNIAGMLVQILAEKKGVVLDTAQMMSYQQFKQMQYDKLADGLRKSMDMDAIYAMLKESR